MTFRALCESRARPIVTAELPTIDVGGLDEVRRRLEPLAAVADAVNATDNTAAHAHASNVSIAIALLRLDVEPIMQVVCRDKNRLALQADILGAALHGVVNVACLTGDDVTAGDEPESRRVFDCDGPQLVAIAEGLRNGTTLGGRPLDPAPDLFVGAVENPGAPRSTSDRCAPPRRRRRARASCSCRSPTAPSSSSRSSPARSRSA